MISLESKTLAYLGRLRRSGSSTTQIGVVQALAPCTACIHPKLANLVLFSCCIDARKQHLIGLQQLRLCAFFWSARPPILFISIAWCGELYYIKFNMRRFTSLSIAGVVRTNPNNVLGLVLRRTQAWRGSLAFRGSAGLSSTNGGCSLTSIQHISVGSSTVFSLQRGRTIGIIESFGGGRRFW
jgi:hypothetical protein